MQSIRCLFDVADSRIFSATSSASWTKPHLTMMDTYVFNARLSRMPPSSICSRRRRASWVSPKRSNARASNACIRGPASNRTLTPRHSSRRDAQSPVVTNASPTCAAIAGESCTFSVMRLATSTHIAAYRGSVGFNSCSNATANVNGRPSSSYRSRRSCRAAASPSLLSSSIKKYCSNAASSRSAA
ncbi:hypothetical protein D9M68_618080 [compost metagenome]